MDAIVARDSGTCVRLIGRSWTKTMMDTMENLERAKLQKN